MAEPIPVDILLTDLDSQWNASNVVEPIFIEVTGANYQTSTIFKEISYTL